MRTETTTTTICKYDELSESAKETARNWWRSCSDGYDHWIDAKHSLDAFLELFGLTCTDYSFGLCNANYATISVDRYDTEVDDWEDGNRWGLSHVRLLKYLQNRTTYHGKKWQTTADIAISADCELTGYCFDESLLDCVREFLAKPDHRTLAELIHDCVDKWTVDVTADIEYQDSEESITESTEANDYEFSIDGDFHA